MGRTPELSRERIIDAAMALLDEEGVAGLTMRGLARHLDVKAASLYYHVRSQDDLIDALQGRINDEVDLSPLAELTPEGFAAFVRSYRDAYRRHPQAIPLVNRRVVRVPSALRLYDALAEHLMGRGLPEEQVMVVLAVIDFIWPRTSTPTRRATNPSCRPSPQRCGQLTRQPWTRCPSSWHLA